MELILTKDVDNLGEVDDIVNVKDGYGRNFLIPQGFGKLATDSAKKMRNENLKQRSHKQAKVLDEAKAIAAKLAETNIVVGTKVGEKGKIFGSVNTIMLADALKEQGFDLDRKKIKINDEPIKHTGKYTAVIQLHKEVSQTIDFEVTGE